MDTAQMGYFLTACQTLNFTQAAKRHFTSRQNLTHAIREIERELGVSLFVREGSSIALTAEGETAAVRMAAALSELEALRLELGGKPAGPLRVVLSTNAFSFSPFDIPAFLDKIDPGSCILEEAGCEECCERVADGRNDVAIAFCQQRDFPGCRSLRLNATPLHFLLSASSPLASRESLSLEDLAGVQLQMPADYAFKYGRLLDLLGQRGVELGGLSVLTSFELVLRLVKGEGYACVMSPRLAENPPEGTVVRPLREPGTEVGMYALFKKSSSKLPAIRDFVDLLSDEFSA